MTAHRTVAITGANGFIGKALLEAFAREGYRTVALVRAQRQAIAAHEIREFDLRSPPSASLLDGVDALIHAAYAPRAFDDNVEGARRLLAAARATGVGHVTLISSLSARADAPSTYGRQKFVLETLAGAGDAVVRPGLVIGSGGLFARTVQFVRASPVVPLFGGGRQLLQAIDVRDVVTAIVRITGSGLTGRYDVAQQQPVAYREFYAAIGGCFGKHPRFVSIPFWFANAALAAAAATGLRLPVDRDNLRGLQALRVCDTSASLTRLHLAPVPWESAVTYWAPQARA